MGRLDKLIVRSGALLESDEPFVEAEAGNA
jgi:hypothetical protein